MIDNHVILIGKTMTSFGGDETLDNDLLQYMKKKHQQLEQIIDNDELESSKIIIEPLPLFFKHQLDECIALGVYLGPATLLPSQQHSDCYYLSTAFYKLLLQDDKRIR
jgi:hypothetical protein